MRMMTFNYLNTDDDILILLSGFVYNREELLPDIINREIVNGLPDSLSLFLVRDRHLWKG
jgi:hypothetical protein